MDWDLTGAFGADWIFSAWASDTSDRDGYVCHPDAYVFCGFPGGWDAGAFGADLTVCGAFDSIHYALLYARKWSAEDVCPVWSDIGADT